MPSLLVAGPSRLEDHGERRDLVGGTGATAAMAAAPLAHTQLWSRGGSAFTEGLLDHLRRRGVDLAGFERNGTGASASDLAELEPVAAAELGVVLEAGLGPEDTARCRRALADLDGTHLRVVLAPEDTAAERWPELARCDLLIAGADQVGRDLGADPAVAADRLRAAGAGAVALCAGALGGLLAYKQRRATWAATPADLGSHPGRRAIFAGVLAGLLAARGSMDFRHLKRQVTTAGAVAASCGRGPGPIRLLGADAAAYRRAYLQLRRNNKA